MTRLRIRCIAAALATSFATFAAPGAAQTVGYNVRTGDVWVDTRLGEINRYGLRHRDPFVDELHRHYGAPRSLVLDLLDRRRWAPADVYYACAIANSLGLPCIDVVREYDRDPGRGWGAVAKRMGIKPGSPAFHALKRGTVATYDRWGHPVSIDRNVRVDWSDERRGPPARAGRDHGPAHAAHGRGHGKPTHPGNGKGNGGGKGEGKGKGRGGRD